MKAILGGWTIAGSLLLCQTAQAILPVATPASETPTAIPTTIMIETEANEPLPDEGTLGVLATPLAERPAAGICGSSETPSFTITIFPDIPDPRCALLRSDQSLRLLNRREETIEISLAGYRATLEPGEAYEFPAQVGDLLAPGVHRIEVAPCCSAELWLRE